MSVVKYSLLSLTTLPAINPLSTSAVNILPQCISCIEVYQLLLIYFALRSTFATSQLACTRLSVSEHDRKIERATSGINGWPLLFPCQTLLVARPVFSIVRTDREPGTGHISTISWIFFVLIWLLKIQNINDLYAQVTVNVIFTVWRV